MNTPCVESFVLPAAIHGVVECEEGWRESLQEILEQRSLSAIFQPIMDMREGDFFGFEGLIRGPANTPLHAPASLFKAAQQCDLLQEVEMLCRQVVLESFARLKLPGNLFLNVSPEALLHPTFRSGRTLEFIERLGLAPERVVIELTENQPTFDFETTRNALLHYRSMGFRIALDDLGAGFSSLRLWSELRPEFVKIDMHFVQGVNVDPLKLQFLRSIRQIATSSNTRVIAEGVETEGELAAIRGVGMDFCQGYYIARPAAVPPLVPPPEAGRMMGGRQAGAGCSMTGQACTAEKLLVYVEPAHPKTDNNTIFARFSRNPSLRAIPIVDGGRPVGLVNRYAFIDHFAQPFQRELLGKRPCLQEEQKLPLLVEKDTAIHELSQFLAESESRYFADGFIITDKGRYLGIGTGQDLLRAITRMQIEAARYANPLTMLPGNVPINERIEGLLHENMPFHICYCDLDNFKPFNDVYGYRRGDEMIQLTGRALSAACDPVLDFVGHVGGDDFILLMRSADWRNRCDMALQSFAQASTTLVNDEHRMLGGYESEDRNGRLVFHRLPTLSIGVVQVEPDLFQSHHDVSAAAAVAKKMAKGMQGNSLFLEQRRLSN